MAYKCTLKYGMPSWRVPLCVNRCCSIDKPENVKQISLQLKKVDANLESSTNTFYVHYQLDSKAQQGLSLSQDNHSPSGLQGMTHRGI